MSTSRYVGYAQVFESDLHYDNRLAARNTPSARAFMNDWLSACLRRDLLESQPNPLPHRDFQWHTHEQCLYAILSALQPRSHRRFARYSRYSRYSRYLCYLRDPLGPLAALAQASYACLATPCTRLLSTPAPHMSRDLRYHAAVTAVTIVTAVTAVTAVTVTEAVPPVTVARPPSPRPAALHSRAHMEHLTRCFSYLRSIRYTHVTYAVLHARYTHVTHAILYRKHLMLCFSWTMWNVPDSVDCLRPNASVVRSWMPSRASADGYCLGVECPGLAPSCDWVQASLPFYRALPGARCDPACAGSASGSLPIR